MSGGHKDYGRNFPMHTTCTGPVNGCLRLTRQAATGLR